MEEYNPLSDARIVVPCNACIFGKYRDNTQIDCHAEMLSKLKENGAEIIEAYDNEKEFYIIKDRVCVMRRVEAWKNHVGKDKTIEELLDIARKEVQSNTTVEAVVYIYENDREKILTTLDSIYNENILPNKVCFIVKKGLKISQVVSIVKGYNHKLPWDIHAIVDDVDTRRAIDIIINTKCKYPYYATFEIGKPVRSGIFAEIKERLVDKMERFMHNAGDDDESIHNEIVNTEIHKFLHGNTQLPIGDKIRGLKQREQQDSECSNSDNVSQ